MALFDFGRHSGAEAVEIATTTHHLAVRTGVDATSLLDVGHVAGKIISNPIVSGTTAPRGEIPQGWHEVDPHKIGFSGKEIGYNDYILVDSPVLGAVDGTIQFKVFQSEDGRLAISWAATNNPLDVADFTKLNSGEAGPLMDKALTKVAAYAKAHGIDADDVLVTGYSLGAAYTVLMAENQATLADGFFSKATYVAHDGPISGEGIPNLLNFGYENDIVYRAAGNFGTIKEALAAAGPLLTGSDFNLQDTADNVVLFDGAYANPLFPLGAFSILNPVGWYGHGSGLFTDAIDRIGRSSFYELTNRDSAVVVSTLGADLRQIAWVEDKASPATNDHIDKSAFLIGTEFADKIRDGIANDFIDGMGGDDLIRVSTGMDIIDGGEGRDTLRLRGDAKDWDVYRLKDGSLAFVDKDGLKIATDVERVEFEGFAIGKESLFNAAYDVSSQGLRFDGNWFERFFNKDVGYSHAVEGTSGNDVLSGSVVFAQGGSDRVTGTSNADVLYGGDGRDLLRGGAGDDRLYGGAHDDLLISDGGNDVLNGGHGQDVFAFTTAASGTVRVEDFSNAMGETDLLLVQGMTGTQVLSAASQHGDDVVITLDHVKIILEHTQMSALTEDSFAVV